MKKKILISLSVFVILFSGFLFFAFGKQVFAACGNGYSFCRSITFDHTKDGSANTSNFTALIAGTYSYLATTGNGGGVQNTTTQSGGGVSLTVPADVIFTTDSACTTKVAGWEYESYNASTGAVTIWVNVGTLTFNSDLVVYECYGKASVTTWQGNVNASWDSSYRGVYHLAENAANTTVNDSTSNAFTGVAGANTSGVVTTGKISGARGLTGAGTDNVNLESSNHFSASGGNYTLSAWVQPVVSHARDGYIFSIGSFNTGNVIHFDTGANSAGGHTALELNTNIDANTELSSNGSVVEGSWNRLDVVLNSSTGVMTGYINGVLTGTSTYTTLSSLDGLGGGGSAIGARYSNNSGFYNGTIDEFRFSATARSASQILSEYNNQNSPSTFYAIGSEQTSSGTASITMSSATLGADGLTITVPMSGFTGTLSCPSNACSGFTVDGVNGVTAISSVSVSSSNVIITMTHEIAASESPTITLSSGSNITDSSGDSATGQSSFTVTNSSTWYFMSVAPFSTNSRAQASGTLAGLLGYANMSWSTPDGILEFNTTSGTTAINIRVFDASGNANIWCLYSDGAVVGSCYTPTADNAFSTGPGWTVSGAHTVGITNVSSYAGGSNYLAMVQITGGSGLGSRPATKPFIAACGDSIAIYVSTPILDTRQGDWWQVSQAIGAVNQHFGITGIHVSNFGTSNQLVDQCGETMTFSSPPSVITLTGGENDLNSGSPTPQGAIGSPNTFKGDYYSMITNVCAAVDCTSTKLVARGILPNAYTGSGSIATYNSYIQSVVTQWNISNPTKPVIYMGTTGWINTTTDLAGDSLHPSVAGYAKVANREIPVYNGLINSSSFSVSGPSSGLFNAASTNFTVTLAGGATFTGDQTITILDGSAGGTFTPSVGSATTTSAVTVTPTDGATSFTFTYTPSSVGTKTISFINDQDAWTNPTNISYVASASVPGAPTGVSAVAGLQSATVSFTAPVSTGGSTITNYEVTSNPGSVTGIGSASPITVSGLTEGISYTFTVTASNAVGTSTASSASSAVIPTAPVLVTPPASSGGGGGGGGIAGSYGVVNIQPIAQSTPASIITTLQEQIVALTAQLNQLLLQVGLSSLPSTISLPFTRDLTLHDNNADVKRLQQFLNTHGFIITSSGVGSPGNETTLFGTLTYKALLKYQKSVGISASGFFGPKTRAYVNSLK